MKHLSSFKDKPKPLPNEEAEDEVDLNLTFMSAQEQSKPSPSKETKAAEGAEDEVDLNLTFMSAQEQSKPLPSKDAKPVEDTKAKANLRSASISSEKKTASLPYKDAKPVKDSKTNPPPISGMSKMQTRIETPESDKEDSTILDLNEPIQDGGVLASSSTRKGGGAPGDPSFKCNITIEKDPDNKDIKEEINRIENSPYESESTLEDNFFFKKLQTVYNWIILLLGGWAVFTLLQKVVAFYADLQGMVPWAKWTLGSAFALLIGGILVLLFQILRFMYRLPRKADILAELERRKAYRQLNRQKRSEVCKELAKLLVFKEGKDEYKHTLIIIGFTAREIEPVINNGDNLLQKHENMSIPDSQWIAEYKSYQNECLEKLAYSLIEKTSKKAAFLATLSPFPLGDRLIILSLSLQMLKQLMLIYHLRPSTFNAWILLSQISLSSYASGYTQDAALKLGDFAKKLVAGIPVVEGITQATTQLTTESALHGLLVYRIGEQIVKKLRVIN